MGESKTHQILKQVALRWVQRTGCVVFACEVNWGFVGTVDVAELWKLVNSQRLDFVYYIIADRVDTDDLPPIFGILDENGRIVRKARRRQRVQTLGARLADFERFARVCSWRAYGHVIRQEQEQMEFSMVPDRSA